MAQQTAVEWLELVYHSQQGYLSKIDIEQAKAMEKNQIIDAYSFGYSNGFDDASLPNAKRIDDSEQYFNQTYHANKH